MPYDPERDVVHPIHRGWTKKMIEKIIKTILADLEKNGLLTKSSLHLKNKARHETQILDKTTFRVIGIDSYCLSLCI